MILINNYKVVTIYHFYYRSPHTQAKYFTVWNTQRINNLVHKLTTYTNKKTSYDVLLMNSLDLLRQYT